MPCTGISVCTHEPLSADDRVNKSTGMQIRGTPLIIDTDSNRTCTCSSIQLKPLTQTPEDSVHISEVSLLYSGKKEAVLGERKGVLIREVSSFQGCP